MKKRCYTVTKQHRELRSPATLAVFVSCLLRHSKLNNNSITLHVNACMHYNINSLDIATLHVQGMTTTGCACPGDILTYECAVTGGPGGATVWTGTVFNCTQNEISLVHSRFNTPSGAFGLCNNGAIKGYSIGVEANYYTSQLNVTMLPSTSGKSVSCSHDNTSSITVQFSAVTPRIIGISHPLLCKLSM